MTLVHAMLLLLLPVWAHTATAYPEFCHGLDCPTFKLVQDCGRGIELRRYDPASWVVTRVQERTYEQATSRGFHRLFKYIFGDNEREEHIEMTAPVVTAVELAKDRQFKEEFSVSFFLPYKYQESHKALDLVPGRPHHRRHRSDEAPSPKDSLIKLVDFDGFDAYVKTFGEYAFGFRLRRLVKDFLDDLEQQGIKDFDCTSVLVAVYDPPFKLIDRHNELWVLRRRKEATQ